MVLQCSVIENDIIRQHAVLDSEIPYLSANAQEYTQP